MPKRRTKTKATHRAERWTDQHRLLSHLLEEELHGLVSYLRGLHYLAIVLFLCALGGVVFSIRSLFENGQHGVTGFIAILLTCFTSGIAALLSLRPWILPRFLLPIDIHQLRYDEMMAVMSSPREYIHLLKHHVQQLTDTYLLRKLKLLRLSIFAFLFGVSVALLLCISLP